MFGPPREKGEKVETEQQFYPKIRTDDPPSLRVGPNVLRILNKFTRPLKKHIVTLVCV